MANYMHTLRAIGKQGRELLMIRKRGGGMAVDRTKASNLQTFSCLFSSWATGHLPTATDPSISLITDVKS